MYPFRQSDLLPCHSRVYRQASTHSYPCTERENLCSIHCLIRCAIQRVSQHRQRPGFRHGYNDGSRRQPGAPVWGETDGLNIGVFDRPPISMGLHVQDVAAAQARKGRVEIKISHAFTSPQPTVLAYAR